MKSSFEKTLILLTEQKSPNTNVVGVARSLLALGLLLTLLFNPTTTLAQVHAGKLFNPYLNSNFILYPYNFFMILGEGNFFIMKYIAILILIIVISGYWLKITSILHWWIASSFVFTSSTIDGGDQMGAIFSLFLIPILFFDDRKNHWYLGKKTQNIKKIVPIVTIWILRLQVSIIYFHAPVGKFSGKEWANGTAIYYWWNQSIFGMPLLISDFINSLLENSYIVTMVTYSVMILEILIFLGLSASVRYRKTILLVAVVFHLSIILVHGIFSFFFSICAGLILFLFPTYENFEFSKFKS